MFDIPHFYHKFIILLRMTVCSVIWGTRTNFALFMMLQLMPIICGSQCGNAKTIIPFQMKSASWGQHPLATGYLKMVACNIHAVSMVGAMFEHRGYFCPWRRSATRPLAELSVHSRQMSYGW